MRIRTLFLIFAGALLVGAMTACHAQVPPVSYSVALSWQAPASTSTWPGCTAAAPCTYVMSRITLTAGTASCPAPNTATPNYTPVNAASPATALTYTDAGSSGTTACYVVQTEQGGAVSGPSNTAGPFVVPGNPTAPSLNGSVADDRPLTVAPLPLPTLARGSPGSLTARVLTADSPGD